MILPLQKRQGGRYRWGNLEIVGRSLGAAVSPRTVLRRGQAPALQRHTGSFRFAGHIHLIYFRFPGTGSSFLGDQKTYLPPRNRGKRSWRRDRTHRFSEGQIGLLVRPKEVDPAVYEIGPPRGGGVTQPPPVAEAGWGSLGGGLPPPRNGVGSVGGGKPPPYEMPFG